MLWSVMPEALVFAGAEPYGGGSFNSVDGYVGNCACRLRAGGDGSFFIERLNSTDPRDFMRPELRPGQRVWQYQI